MYTNTQIHSHTYKRVPHSITQIGLNGFRHISSVIVNTAAACNRKDSEKIFRKIREPVAKTRFDIFSRIPQHRSASPVRLNTGGGGLTEAARPRAFSRSRVLWRRWRQLQYKWARY